MKKKHDLEITDTQIQEFAFNVLASREKHFGGPVTVSVEDVHRAIERHIRNLSIPAGVAYPPAPSFGTIKEVMEKHFKRIAPDTYVL